MMMADSSGAHFSNSRRHWSNTLAGATTSADSDVPTGAKQPQRHDRLYRLAQPHIVREQQAMTIHQRAHSLQLERHQLAAPLQLRVSRNHEPESAAPPTASVPA